MGTPRASASVDQMRNVQRSASRAGECTAGWALMNVREGKGAETAGARSACRIGAIITSVCCIVSGATAGATGLCCGQTHDFIVAQQAVQFINGVAGMLMPHLCAGACDAIVTRAIISKTPTVNRLCTLT